MSIRRVGVLADDFSGAGDVALAFQSVGMTAEIWTPAGEGEKPGPERVPSFPKTRVWIIDTESRGLSPRAAVRAVRGALRTLAPWKPDFIFKKIDSTLRGPVGAELRAFLNVLRPAGPVPVVPAFPRMGRTTVGGRHFVDGVPLNRTPFGKDPRHPIRSNDLNRILDPSCPSGSRQQNVSARERVWVPDVVDSRSMVLAARRALLGRVAVGSAGFAGAIAHLWHKPLPREKAHGLSVGPLRRGRSPSDARATQTRGAPVGVVIGSAHPLSARQAERMKNFLPGAGVFVLKSSPRRGVPEKILRHLVNRARALEKDHGIRRWVATGGETAFALARLWRKSRWRVVGSVEPGVPLCRSLGGNPRFLVMKPGGFGSVDVFRKAVRRLRRKEGGIGTEFSGVKPEHRSR